VTLPAALGGKQSTKRFTNAVNQLEQMRQYALNPDKLCRHAQVGSRESVSRVFNKHARV
jgi:hypothetical protein